MSNNFQFELVTPEQIVCTLQASRVTLTATTGSMSILANHAPVVAALGKGKLEVESEQGVQTFLLDDGFAEFSQNQLVVLSELAQSV